MKAVHAQEAARLAERAGVRRDDGFRGRRARRAWRRLVRACEAGDVAAQEAVRTAELTDADVLDLLAAALAEPADRAAYLVLIGQKAQYRALDPDGSLLALAYRAATPETRERLRTLLAVEGDTEVIRVVVTGEQRDRLAEMSYDELDYLGHQLAEHLRWDELRELVRDLPLAKAAAAARLLPAGERGTGAAKVLASASVPSPAQLRALVERLPRRRLVRHDVTASFEGASFSPDSSELALRYRSLKRIRIRELHVDTLRIGTGSVTRAFTGDVLTDRDIGDSVLHLGDEILVRLKTSKDLHRIFRVTPDDEAVGPPAPLSVMRRASGGAVMICPEGLAFVDRAARDLRLRPMPRFGARATRRPPDHSELSGGLTTLPADRLLAFCSGNQVFVANEDGDLLHVMPIPWESPRFGPALSFLSPNSLAVHHRTSSPDEQPTRIWEFPPHGAPRLTGHHRGPIRKRWPLEEWRGQVLDDAFAARVHSAEGRWIDPDVPWLQRRPEDHVGRTLRRLLAVSPGQDMFVTCLDGSPGGFEVHSPHLPSARELLERPLPHATPADVRRIRDLRNRIGAADVQQALDLLSACLTDRFGSDIALGATGSGPSGGPHDIALGEDGRQ